MLVLAEIQLAKAAVDKPKADLCAATAAQPRRLLNYMTLVTEYEKDSGRAVYGALIHCGVLGRCGPLALITCRWI
jgi:hypothetical protein